MNISVRQLGPRTLKIIESFEHSPDPDPWVADVEQFLLGTAARDVVIKRIRHLWVVENDGTPVGLAANRQHQSFNAELVQAMMIDHRFRGQGLARPVLDALLVAVHDAADAQYVAWLVHPDNAVMRHVSAGIDPSGGVPQSDGYLLFAHER